MASTYGNQGSSNDQMRQMLPGKRPVPVAWPAQLAWLGFSFDGRIGRAAYGLGTLGCLLFALIYFFGFSSLWQALVSPLVQQTSTLSSFIQFFPIVLVIWAHISLTTKRFKDAGWPGILGAFAPMLGFLPLAALALILPRRP